MMIHLIIYFLHQMNSCGVWTTIIFCCGVEHTQKVGHFITLWIKSIIKKKKQQQNMMKKKKKTTYGVGQHCVFCIDWLYGTIHKVSFFFVCMFKVNNNRFHTKTQYNWLYLVYVFVKCLHEYKPIHNSWLHFLFCIYKWHGLDNGTLPFTVFRFIFKNEKKNTSRLKMHTHRLKKRIMIGFLVSRRDRRVHSTFNLFFRSEIQKKNMQIMHGNEIK